MSTIEETFYKNAFQKLSKEVIELANKFELMYKFNAVTEVHNPPVELPEYITYHDKRIVQYIADGLLTCQIAEKERRSKRTVDVWIDRLHKKTGISKSTCLVALFFRNGWIK
jgi:DNA-binding NarL/FixJ family response regulator